MIAIIALILATPTPPPARPDAYPASMAREGPQDAPQRIAGRSVVSRTDPQPSPQGQPATPDLAAWLAAARARYGLAGCTDCEVYAIDARYEESVIHDVTGYARR